MASLWFAIVVLTALALLFVVVPVWRFRGGEQARDLEVRKQKNIEVFQQRKDELDQDLTNGEITTEEHAKLVHELERSFLRDMDAFDREESSGAATGHRKTIPLVAAVAVLAFSVVLYQGWGAGRDLALPELLERLREASDAASQEQALDDLADFLQARFERLPDDVQNGYMLGTLYLQLERFEEAEGVFERLAEAELEPADRATILGQLAQARYLAAGREITPEVREVMDQALALNPNEYAVMSLLALDAFMQEDFSAALGYWRRQLSQITPGSDEAQALQERIARVQALLPEAEQPAEVAGDAGTRIEVHVEMDPAIAGEVSEDMRVFVYARGTDRPVPLAAESFAVSDLPLTVTLDDSSAMTPQFTLSSAETVFVGARISMTGEATAQPGDFQAVSEAFEAAEREDPVTLVIKDRVD